MINNKKEFSIQNRSMIIKRKIKYFLLFFIVFGNVSFAKTSDQEKINIIKQLAKPSPEKTVSYKWVSKKDKDNLFPDGQISLEIYESFMNFKEDFDIAGPGIYVNAPPEERPPSGEVLLQIETQPGYRFLNLSDETTLRTLKEQDISLKDVYRLDSGIALEGFETSNHPIYSKYRFVFKGKEDLKITPFTGKGIPLFKLMDIVLSLDDLPPENERFFLLSIQKDLKERVEKYISIMEKDISKKELEREFSQQFAADILYTKASSLIPLSKFPHIQIGDDLLFLGSGGSGNKNILPKKYLRKIAKYMLEKSGYSNIFIILKETFSILSHLSTSDKLELVDKVIDQIVTFDDGLYFLEEAGVHLPKKGISKVVNKIIPLIKTAQEGTKLLKDSTYNNYYKENFQEPPPKLLELAKKFMDDEPNTKFHDDKLKAEAAQKMAKFLLEILNPGMLQESKKIEAGLHNRYTLSSKDREKIIDRTLEFVQSEAELIALPLLPEEMKETIEKFISFQCKRSISKEMI